MKAFAVLSAIVLAGCVSAPERLTGAKTKPITIDGVKMSVQFNDTEAFSLISATATPVRFVDQFEDVRLHRRAILAVTGCKAVNHTLHDWAMLADLEC